MSASTLPARVYRRRRLTALAVLAGVTALIALVINGLGGDEPARAPNGRPAAVTLPQLPRGGRSLMPEFRVVAYYGAPQSHELGALGIGTPDAAVARLLRQARPYVRVRRPVIPALELIAVIAHADAGDDGLYSLRQPDSVIRSYLAAARKAKALLLLDIQPGRSDFFTEAVRLEKWLREPDVGLALDPEWHVAAGEVPGKVIGSVDSREINATTAWLEQLTRSARLPEKLVVIHQFTDDMVDDTTVKARKGLEIVLNADGFGSQAVKKAKYHAFTRQAPGFGQGFKLFYEEDLDLMKPRQVLRLHPPPDFIVYE